MRIAPCRWAPALLAVRRVARRLSGGKEPFYPLRWLLNAALLLLLTGSLFLAILEAQVWAKKRLLTWCMRITSMRPWPVG